MSWKTKHLNLSFLFYSIKFKIHLGLIHHSTPPARVESGLQGMERDWDKEGTDVGGREGSPGRGGVRHHLAAKTQNQVAYVFHTCSSQQGPSIILNKMSAHSNNT